MKLDKREVVARRIAVMEKEGIKFVCNANVGENVEPQLLVRDFDATIICTGATLPRDLDVEGRNLKGVHFAMDFLTASTQAVLADQPDATPISAKGKDVVVLGGGDTGTDCVGTSMRHGCRSLQQIEIMAMPPMDRAADNPWPEWPKVYKMDYGQEEAAAKFGSDPRVYLTTVKKFVGDGAGNLTGVVTVNITWEKNDKGQFIPVEQPGSEKEHPAQLVLLAMGFLGPEQAAAQGTQGRGRCAQQREGRARQVLDLGSWCVRRRRCAPRSVAGGLGDQRGSRSRARVRSLPDGRHRAAVASCLELRQLRFHQRTEVRLRLRGPHAFLFFAPHDLACASLRMRRANCAPPAAHRDRNPRRSR